MVESPETQQKYNLLEERLRAVEGVNILGGIEASELTLLQGLVIPSKFKVPNSRSIMGPSAQQ